jgi:hypothetical protein
MDALRGGAPVTRVEASEFQNLPGLRLSWKADLTATISISGPGGCGMLNYVFKAFWLSLKDASG